MSHNRDHHNNRQNYYNPYHRTNPNQNRHKEFHKRQNSIKLNDTNALIYIHPWSSYNQAYPFMVKPKELGILLSEKRVQEIESKNNKKEDYEKYQGIKYLALPNDCDNLNYDLRLGIEKFVQHIPHQNGIDNLLKWILENKHKICQNDTKKPLKTDFVCWRGLLTTMSVSPYDKNKDWMFSIILHRGTIYMCEIETESHKNERLNPDERTRSFTYWGHKFETYITTDLPGEKPSGPDEVPDPENNFSTIISNQIGEHSLMYGAEIDCCIHDKHHQLSDYCEIKTSRGESVNDLNFRKNSKFLKWWIQSYLVDIKLIKVGLRTDDGIIKKIIDCNVNDLLDPKRWWKENICLNLMKETLDCIKKFCTQEDHVYIASRDINADTIRIYKTQKDSEDFTKNYFLHQWYTKSI